MSMSTFLPTLSTAAYIVMLSIHLVTPHLALYVGATPTMQELVRFRGVTGRLNIAREISTRYFIFGVHLLEDRSPARIMGFEHKHSCDPFIINCEILSLWLQGTGRKPVTWATLIEVLQEVECFGIAAEIEATKKGPFSA